MLLRKQIAAAGGIFIMSGTGQTIKTFGLSLSWQTNCAREKNAAIACGEISATNKWYNLTEFAQILSPLPNSHMIVLAEIIEKCRDKVKRIFIDDPKVPSILKQSSKHQGARYKFIILPLTPCKNVVRYEYPSNVGYPLEMCTI